MEIKLPPVLYNEEGKIRKVGLELEFGQTDLDTAAQCIVRLFGGEISRKSNFFQEVKDTDIGKFTLKMDAVALNSKTYEPLIEKMGLKAQEQKIDDMIESMAAVIVPYEIMCPPVPVTEVGKLEELRLELHRHQAKGTKSSIFNTYATHINAELPALNHEVMLAYLRAFHLLYPYLFEISSIDLTRAWSQYIRPFPIEYIKLVLAPDYRPDQKTFIDDYKDYNPDRNRPLDLYPVIGYLKPEAVLGLESIKPRPTFHYRLPNSLMDDPEWSLVTEWNSWVLIEALAYDNSAARELSKAFLELEEQTLIGFKKNWIKRIENWIHDLK